MSRWWRITSPQYASDTSGQGAAIHGGRWNSAGVPAIYAGDSIALSALEKWVHLAGIFPDVLLVLVAIDVPDPNESGLIVDLSEGVPSGWSSMPRSRDAELMGDELLSLHNSGIGLLGFTVPSVIVPEAQNLVLNPKHPNITKVHFSITRYFSFDERMVGPEK